MSIPWVVTFTAKCRVWADSPAQALAIVERGWGEELERWPLEAEAEEEPAAADSPAALAPAAAKLHYN